MSAGRVAGLFLMLGLWSCQSGPVPSGERPSSSSSPTRPHFSDAWSASFDLGRPATSQEIAAWDIDVRPDGAGLPPGRGTVAEGEVIYRSRCAACHGPTGTEGPNDRLVGREPGDSFPFGQSAANRSRQTIGSYWPYATTVYDYINRAMPQNAPGSLTANEVYALTGYLLYLNQLVPRDAVMDAKSLPAVVMPARDRFVPDDRSGGPVVR